jgi:hypothetical protein
MSSQNLAPSTELKTTGTEGVVTIVTSLQKVWTRLQKIHPTLPDATIIVKSSPGTWGHTSVLKPWGAQAVKGRGKAKTVTLTNLRHEVMISSENLSRGPEAVLGTLLHEAAHALNLAAGVRDCDSNGRHNKLFKATAEAAFGLDIKELGWIGWSDTYTPAECLTRWATELRMIKTGLAKASVTHHPKALTAGGTTTIVLPPKGKTKTGGRAKNLTRAVCECEADASGWVPSIRASAKVLAIGILCEDCKAYFQVTGN